MKLLNVDANAKTIKGQKLGYLTGIMYLSPSDLSGHNLCPMAKVAKCDQACLNFQGRAAMSKDSIKFTAPNGLRIPDNRQHRCRLRRTELFNTDKPTFFQLLIKEIHALIRKGKRDNLIPTVRLNGTSDIRWENIKHEGKTIFEMFPAIQFYDYTKISNRKKLPANYSLTWSYSNANTTYAATRPIELNWAVVFRNKLPETFLGRPVIDGDISDVRFIDPTGVVVGLKAKGSAKKDTSGFVV